MQSIHVNLLLFNLATDKNHVTLGFAVRTVAELARHFDHVDVVTMHEGVYTLPANVIVWSVGREKSYSKPRRVLEFYKIIFRILRQRRIDAVFTHMIPVFAVLFWPIAMVLRKRNVLWYAHRTTPLTLRLAHWAVDRVLSPTPESFRLPSNKVDFVGQGVDLNIFRPPAHREHDALQFRITYVGRISPVKQLDMLFNALEEWVLPDGRQWRLDIVGAATTDVERVYEERMRTRAHALEKHGEVLFHGRLEPSEASRYLQGADVFINLSNTGSLDKALIEAMACGCIVLSSNDSFCAIARKESIKRCCMAAEPVSIRETLDYISSLSNDETLSIRQRLIEIASKHSFDGLIRRFREALIGQNVDEVS